MATEFKIIKCNGNEIDSHGILAMGNYFSGSIYHDKSRKSWISFNLVNKEKMEYILNGISLNKGVEIEIFTYVKYPEKIQRPDPGSEFI